MTPLRQIRDHAALFTSSLLILLTCLLWYFGAFKGGPPDQNSILAWFGTFVSCVSLTFGLFMVVLAIDAYAQLAEIRNARTAVSELKNQISAARQSVLKAIPELSSALFVAHQNAILATVKGKVDSVVYASIESDLAATSRVRQLAFDRITIAMLWEEAELVLPAIQSIAAYGDVADLELAEKWVTSQSPQLNLGDLLATVRNQLIQKRLDQSTHRG